MNRFDVALGKPPEPPAPDTRVLTKEEEAVVEQLYRKKGQYQDYSAYITAAKPIMLRKWQGHGADPEYIEEEIPPGQTLKIVMVSRFGDCGLTDNLEAVNGYHVRLNFDDSALKDIRLTREPARQTLYCSRDDCNWDPNYDYLGKTGDARGVCGLIEKCSSQITREQFERLWAQADEDSRHGYGR